MPQLSPVDATGVSGSVLPNAGHGCPQRQQEREGGAAARQGVSTRLSEAPHQSRNLSTKRQSSLLAKSQSSTTTSSLFSSSPPDHAFSPPDHAFSREDHSSYR